MKTPTHRPNPRAAPALSLPLALKTLAALTLLAALSLLLYAAIPTGAQTTPTDYDANDNGLIDITNLHQLNALRYDLDGNGIPASNADDYNAAFPDRDTAPATRMGCPAGTCTGYELMNNLDFDTDASGTVTTTDDYPNWTPIGNLGGAGYNAEFNGNAHTIANLTIHGQTAGSIGLFGVLDPNGAIRRVGLISASVTATGGGATSYIGTLIGANVGAITAAYATGSAVRITGDTLTYAGGLAGSNQGTITAAYANANVNAGASIGSSAGGLVGINSLGGAITAAYAIGPVSGTGANTHLGGLAGYILSASTTITHSYCNPAVHPSPTNCIGDRAPSANTASTTVPAQTAAQLQTPTGYTGIYQNWNVDITGDGVPDDPWNFGAATDYPTLKTTLASPEPEPPAADYDATDNGLIDVNTLHQLNAIRYDLNGDGLPDATSSNPAYLAAFPNASLATATRMGCPAGACTGYELTASLDFDANNDGRVTNADPYPSWTPIANVRFREPYSYKAEFNGNGHTISNLTIVGYADASGLFGYLWSNGVIRDVGLINPYISTNDSVYNAILVSGNFGQIISSYVEGGSIVVTGSEATNMGAITGGNAGTIRAVYSTALINAGGTVNSKVGGLVGLTNNGTTAASYAAGRVIGTGPYIGAFIGRIAGSRAAIVDSYCDTSVNGTSTPCFAERRPTADAAATAIPGYSTTELQTPTGYTGIYQNWNLDLNDDSTPDYPWYFGTTTTYPTLNNQAQRQAQRTNINDNPPPADAGGNGNGGNGNGGNGGTGTGNGNGNGNGGTGTGDNPPPALPGEVTGEAEEPETYNAAAAHPEVYENTRFEMTASCQTHNPHPETGNPQAATITFDLGNYRGAFILTLSIWHNERYMTYETQDLTQPTLKRTGQTAVIRIETNPAETRFLLRDLTYGGLNLLTGYADCHTDDP